MNKICEHCGIEFSKPSKLAYWQWEQTKFCSQKCNARHKPCNSEYRRTWDANKKRPLHRVMMEEHLGRKLNENEIVHHVNGNKHDNRLENLEVMSALDHGRLHNLIHPLTTKCAICGNEFTPHKTKRARTKTCGMDCKKKLLSISNSKPQQHSDCLQTEQELAK